MRELSGEEREVLETRRTRLEAFLAERMPVLADFAEGLGLASPTMIVADPEAYLPSVDEFMRNQVVEAEGSKQRA